MRPSNSNSQLLKISEQLTENLSSVQISKTLDTLLFRSLDPIINHTNFMEYVATELIVHIFQNARRKFSNKPTQEIKDSLFSFIVRNSKTNKTPLIKNLGLERTIYFRMLSLFEQDAEKYIQTIERVIEHNDKQAVAILSDIEAKYSSVTENFYLVCCEVLFWTKKAYSFRNMIVEKYVRLAHVEATSSVSETALNISRDDLTKDLIVSIFKAIDKFDPERGTLTSYIKWWFKDAKTQRSNRHEYGVAYEIPVTQRKKFLEHGAVNIAETLDDKKHVNIVDPSESVLERIANDQEHQIFNNIASRVDKFKIFSLLNNVKYTPDKQDIEILKSTL